MKIHRETHQLCEHVHQFYPHIDLTADILWYIVLIICLLHVSILYSVINKWLHIYIVLLSICPQMKIYIRRLYYIYLWILCTCHINLLLVRMKNKKNTLIRLWSIGFIVNAVHAGHERQHAGYVCVCVCVCVCGRARKPTFLFMHVCLREDYFRLNPLTSF